MPAYSWNSAGKSENSRQTRCTAACISGSGNDRAGTRGARVCPWNLPSRYRAVIAGYTELIAKEADPERRRTMAEAVSSMVRRVQATRAEGKPQ